MCDDFSSERDTNKSTVTEPLAGGRIVGEMGSHTVQKRFLFNHTTPFASKGLEKSLCDWRGTMLAQCEIPV